MPSMPPPASAFAACRSARNWPRQCARAAADRQHSFSPQAGRRNKRASESGVGKRTQLKRRCHGAMRKLLNARRRCRDTWSWRHSETFAGQKRIAGGAKKKGPKAQGERAGPEWGKTCASAALRSRSRRSLNGVYAEVGQTLTGRWLRWVRSSTNPARRSRLSSTMRSRDAGIGSEHHQPPRSDRCRRLPTVAQAPETKAAPRRKRSPGRADRMERKSCAPPAWGVCVDDGSRSDRTARASPAGRR